MIFDRWFPFFDVDKTLDEVDRIFGTVGRPLGLRSVPRGAFPAINLYEQDDSLTLTAEAPGMNADDIELNVQEESVSLKGERKAGDAAAEECCYRRERTSGTFSRAIALPVPVDPDSVKAEYKNGVLKVQMAKAEKAKARQIPISS